MEEIIVCTSYNRQIVNFLTNYIQYGVIYDQES